MILLISYLFIISLPILFFFCKFFFNIPPLLQFSSPFPTLSFYLSVLQLLIIFSFALLLPFDLFLLLFRFLVSFFVSPTLFWFSIYLPPHSYRPSPPSPRPFFFPLIYLPSHLFLTHLLFLSLFISFTNLLTLTSLSSSSILYHNSPVPLFLLFFCPSPTWYPVFLFAFLFMGLSSSRSTYPHISLPFPFIFIYVRFSPSFPSSSLLFSLPSHAASPRSTVSSSRTFLPVASRPPPASLHSSHLFLFAL